MTGHGFWNWPLKFVPKNHDRAIPPRTRPKPPLDRPEPPLSFGTFMKKIMHMKNIHAHEKKSCTWKKFMHMKKNHACMKKNHAWKIDPFYCTIVDVGFLHLPHMELGNQGRHSEGIFSSLDPLQYMMHSCKSAWESHRFSKFPFLKSSSNGMDSSLVGRKFEE